MAKSSPFYFAVVVARLTGHTHDLGKATVAFQAKLCRSVATAEVSNQPDYIRHEWISGWLLQYLMAEQGGLSTASIANTWVAVLASEGKPDGVDAVARSPISGLNSLQDAAILAVCSHHGAMGGSLTRPDGLDGSKHVRPQGVSARARLGFFSSVGIAHSSKEDRDRWDYLLSQIERDKQTILACAVQKEQCYYEGITLVVRAALILADHKVSSQPFDGGREGVTLFANTKKTERTPAPTKVRGNKVKTGGQPLRYLDQPLSAHLLQVGDLAAANIQMFTGNGLPVVEQSTVSRVLEPTQHPRFVWQNHAANAVAGLQGGKLVFNIASTGAGKTLGNLKIAFAMRPENARLAVAFNLRSLTKQTFVAFQKHIAGASPALFDRDFACLLGGISSGITEFSKEDGDDQIDGEELRLDGAGSLQAPDWLKQLVQDSPSTEGTTVKLIASPVLLSTMDWIVAAGEPGQQARHAKALIRVITSDLILDEVDSYDVAATVAVMRVIKIAASFGRNVIVSSATLSPALAHGIAAAYAAGREVYSAMFGPQPQAWHMVMVSNLFEPASVASPDEDEVERFYQERLQQLCEGLAKNQNITKKYRIVSVPTRADVCPIIIKAAAALHASHGEVPDGLECRVSIGLIRVANISTCLEVSEALRQDGQFVVTAYHARELAERRYLKEAGLDSILSRSDDQWIAHLIAAEPWIKARTGDVRLIVVATPVEEVGRDHDFDWAIIEPSSTHSIVQTAGRVNRHRQRRVLQANIVLLARNMQSLENDNQAVFSCPGLELHDDGNSTHPSHDLRMLLLTKAGSPCSDVLDARLLFDDQAKAMFAVYDEDAISKKIAGAIRVISRAPGYSLHFMLDKFTEAFPLREKNKRYSCSVDLASSGFYYKEAPNQVAGFVQTDGIGGVAENTWLTVKAHDVQGDRLNFAFTLPGHKPPPKQVGITWNGVRLS